MSDTIIVGDGWISEHYFTTDAKSQSFQANVLERRAAWDAEEKDKRDTPRSRFVAARPKLELDLARLAELFDPEAGSNRGDDDAVHAAATAVQDQFLRILEVDRHGLTHERTGPLLRISLPGIKEGAPLVVILALPVATLEEMLSREAVTLPGPFQLVENGEEFKSAARLTSALFVADEAPDLVLILAGRWAVLAEQERWAEGRYLAIDIQLLCERNDAAKGGEIDRALTCLSAESIAPDADGNLWWHKVFEQSIKFNAGDPKDLRDGVRASIEIIANEVVNRRRARCMDPLPQSQAQPLAIQSLRFLYRILFLLYAEASPELGVLPVGAPEYDEGYSLDRIRELVLVKLATPRAQNGTHLYDSLALLFRLVDQGHQPPTAATGDDQGEEDAAILAEGLTFNALRADLFQPEPTGLIDEVGLGNAALQQVLTHLLLTKESRGRDRGYITYAALGINELGKVYEGLMSYTGFFAETDLYEVAKNGDDAKGSWVVPVNRAEGIAPADFVREPDPVTQEDKPVLHHKGSFVFRLAGRERQQSASYYTPEVLTKFTVSQALEEVVDQDGRTSAEDILKLTVCEPALGSGAFAIEAVRQLAEQYLKRKQEEVGEKIDPDQYQRELQKVKAYIALHNVYGVDLNATAVELAEISLWLDTMVEGLAAPWFGLHLRRGNSLVGARRAVFPRIQVSNGTWLKEIPKDVPLTSLIEDIEVGKVGTGLDAGIHHFLLPAEGWGAAADTKEAVELAPDAARSLKAWRRTITAKPTKAQVDALVEIAHRVEVLWQIAHRRLQLAEQGARRPIRLWKDVETPSGTIQREEIEASLAELNGAYQRLHRVMDAWTAMWFWPLNDATTTVNGKRVEPPSLDDWIKALQALVGRNHDQRKRKPAPQGTLTSAMEWNSLNDAEQLELSFAQARDTAAILRDFPWLVVCERVAERQGFFHWNLAFATVFTRGGFDLQVGNPPWVRPDWSPRLSLAEYDPRIVLNADEVSEHEIILRLPSQELARHISDLEEMIGVRAAVSSLADYSLLRGLRADFYRCFMIQTWRNASHRGTIGLIHPETHFTDENAAALRAASYLRLRRHWQFTNELRLFDVHNQVIYGVHVYGRGRSEPCFMQAAQLFHPTSAERSLAHDGSGPEPGVKDEQGRWDERPHARRIVHVGQDTLDTWRTLLTEDVEPLAARMYYTVNASTMAVLSELTRAPRLAQLGLSHSLGWDQTAEIKRGRIMKKWSLVDSWSEVIVQGPHFWVNTPISKSPNETMAHQKDWSPLDIEAMGASYVPPTCFVSAIERPDFDAAFTHWRLPGEQTIPAAHYYRVAWRSMAKAANERTLISAIIPPGATHLTQSVYAAGLPDRPLPLLLDAAGWLGSILSDFFVRAAPKSSIPRSVIDSIPYAPNAALDGELRLRVLRLNCLTSVYADLWNVCLNTIGPSSGWTGGIEWQGRTELSAVDPTWTLDSPLRRAADRRQALLEIDALVALMLGLTADELCTIYRTQFPVLYGYDRRDNHFDRNGRLVPGSVLSVWRKKGDRLTAEERTATNHAGNTYIYELPFVTLDREADMRQAYAHFERILRERS